MEALCIGILLFVPLADLGIKYYIEQNLPEGADIPVRKKLIIRHVHNEGMAFSFLEKYPGLVRRISVLAAVPLAVCYAALFFKKGKTVEKLSLSFILGGAVSNLYDRFVRKYVVDYFGFRTKWKKFSDITFNIGDICIFAGVFGMIFSTVFGKRK